MNAVRRWLRAGVPLWACEFTAEEIVVAGTDRSRRRVAGKAALKVPDGRIAGSLVEANLRNPDELLPALRSALDKAGCRGADVCLIVPDDAVRISVVTLETLPGDADEQLALIRWKLKKTVPFDIDDAQVGFTVLSRGSEVIALVCASPRGVIREYETLAESAGLDPVMVLPSTLAAVSALPKAGGDVLFVKRQAGTVSTTVISGGRVRFYRKVDGTSLTAAVFPTLMFYQDKIGGKGLDQIVVCGADPAGPEVVAVREQFGVPVRGLTPAGIDDRFRAALGALEVQWTSVN